MLTLTITSTMFPTAFQRQFDQPIVTVGRNPDAHLSFDLEMDDQVSWDHALLEWKNGEAFLTDLSSSNGTHLHGKSICQRVKLQEGDVFTLGRTGPEVCVERIATSLHGAPQVSPLDSGSQAPTVRTQSSVKTSNLVLGLGVIATVLLCVLTYGSWQPRKKERESFVKQLAPPISAPETRPSVPAETIDQSGLETTGISYTPVEIGDRFKQAMVWLGAKVNDSTFVVGTGILLRPDAVATSARNLDLLIAAKERGATLLASTDNSGVQMTNIVELMYHPDYDRRDSISKKSMTHDAGLLRLNQAIPSVAEVSFATLKNYTGERVVIVANSPRNKTDSFQTLNDSHPESLFRSGVIFGSSERDGYFTLFNVDSVDIDLNGAGVFNDRGALIGILSVYDNEIAVASSHHLQLLLDGLPSNGDFK